MAKKLKPVVYDNLPKGKITAKTGIGLRFKDDEGTLWETVEPYSGTRVKLRITTFRGISFDAEHYYGSLNVPAKRLLCVKTKSKYYTQGKIHDIMGGSIDRNRPPGAEKIHISIKRKILPFELKTRKFKDYAHFKDPETDRFNTVEELKTEALRVFEKHFSKDWKLETEEF